MQILCNGKFFLLCQFSFLVGLFQLNKENTIEMKFMYFAWAENQFVLISYQMIVCKIPDGTLNNCFISDSNSDLICTIQKCW